MAAQSSDGDHSPATASFAACCRSGALLCWAASGYGPGTWVTVNDIGPSSSRHSWSTPSRCIPRRRHTLSRTLLLVACGLQDQIGDLFGMRDRSEEHTSELQSRVDI